MDTQTAPQPSAQTETMTWEKMATLPLADPNTATVATIPPEVSSPKQEELDLNRQQSETTPIPNAAPESSNTPPVVEANFQTNDPHEILGVPKDADFALIKKRYRALSRKYHPDINKDPQATGWAKIINSAFATLEKQNKSKNNTGTSPAPQPNPASSEINQDQIDQEEKPDFQIPFYSAPELTQAFSNTSLVQELQNKKDSGELVSITPDEIQKIEQETGASWKQMLALVGIVFLDTTMNGGRGVSSFFESYIEKGTNSYIAAPLLEWFGIDQETIENLLDKGGSRMHEVFALPQGMLYSALESFNSLQKEDLVNSLDKQEQHHLLFGDLQPDGTSKNRKDPFGRLNESQIEELFFGDSLTNKGLSKEFLEKKKEELLKH